MPESLYAAIAHRVLAEKQALPFGRGLVVGRWLVSGPADASQAFGDRHSPSTTFITMDVAEWQWHDEGDTFLTYLGGMNDDRKAIVAACAIAVEAETPALLRVYNKGQVRIWHEGRLVFATAPDTKSIDEVFFCTMRAGLNVFLVEKLATSLKFSIDEAGSALDAMAGHCSPAYADRMRTGARIVPDRILGAAGPLECMVVPNDADAWDEQPFTIAAVNSGGAVLWRGQCAARDSVTIHLNDDAGPVLLRACDGGGLERARQYVFIGDVEARIARLKAAWEGQSRPLSGRTEADISSWIDDLADIWRRAESAAYEPRRWFHEEAALLCDSVDRLEKVVDGRADAQTVLASGLVLYAYRSRLDGTLQPYYAYVPPSRLPEEGPRPVVVLLKYLYRRVVIPSFAFDPVLSDIADRTGTVFLSPFGRGINRYEYAGETDVFEALADLGTRHKLDANRIFLAGFSMGGGAAFTLLQKHPAMFAGAFGWSCNIAKDYAPNFAGKRLAYLSGSRDSMFDYPANHAMIQELSAQGSVDAVVNLRTSGGHHFSFNGLQHDVCLAQWAADAPRAPSALTPRAFITDDLHYGNGGWAEIRDAIRPGEPSMISAAFDGGALDVATNNVARLHLRCPSGIPLRVNGYSVGETDIDRDLVAIGTPAMRLEPPSAAECNPAGSGIAEIYYGPVMVIAGDWPAGTTDPAGKWGRRLAKALARPVYYGDFREKYAEIPVVAAKDATEDGLAGASVVAIGSHRDNPWLARLALGTSAEALMGAMASATGLPVSAVVLKIPGSSPGRRNVLVRIDQPDELAAFADTPLFKGQFTPPFSARASLLRHDGLVLCRGGTLYAARLTASWSLACIELFEGNE